MSTLFVDTINEKTSGNGVAIPGHVINTVAVSDSTDRSTTSTSYADSGLSAFSLTARQANTTLYISLFANCRAVSDQMEATVYYSVAGGAYSNFASGGRDGFINLYPNSSANETVSCAGFRQRSITNSAGDTISFKVYLKGHSGGTVEILGNLSPVSVQVLEIGV